MGVPFPSVGDAYDREGRVVRLVVERDGELYRLWVDEDDGARPPVLVPGDAPSWAGGWAGVDSTGLYERQDAVRASAALGLGADAVAAALVRPALMSGPALG